jgi:hypothetical protein
MTRGLQLTYVREGFRAADHLDKSEALFGIEPFNNRVESLWRL